jgi:hypothetical protein
MILICGFAISYSKCGSRPFDAQKNSQACFRAGSHKAGLADKRAS